jgi:nitrate reductase (cytochrome), electron transfer subunit
MKNSIILVISLLWGASLLNIVAADELQSLRGDKAIDMSSNAVNIKHIHADQEPIQRDYIQQPPLIPHKIDNYKINLKFNKCLSCHSWKNYRKAGATKVSQTHFADRQENVLANVSSRRYFCTQCHVPQVDAKPLVENEFKPVQAIR